MLPLTAVITTTVFFPAFQSSTPMTAVAPEGCQMALTRWIVPAILHGELVLCSGQEN